MPKYLPLENNLSHRFNISESIIVVPSNVLIDNQEPSFAPSSRNPWYALRRKPENND